MHPDHLRIEHLASADSLGVTVPRPRLSWRLAPGASAQLAYEIELGDGRSARVTSPDHVLVPWPFDALASRQEVSWRVRTYPDRGESSWSPVATFETGLMSPRDWSAQWIEPDEGTPAPPGARPAYVLRHEFELGAPAGRARLYTTAHGVYETFLNGRRVGDAELSPGFTAYPSTLHVQANDVAHLLVDGTNVWEIVVSDGWYRGKHGNSQKADGFGTTVAALGQLEVGSTVIGTGPGWRWSTGSILEADLMAGQTEDRRRVPVEWRPVLVVDHPYEPLVSSPAPPVRRVEELRPVSVTRLPSGRQVIDLGQNINGWIRLTELGEESSTIELLHGEALDPATGDVTVAHLEPNPALQLGQLDRVVSAGRPGDVFEPRHTVHGFQYVRVDGHTERLTPDDALGIVVHSDLRRTGWFRCSDERVNRLHDIAEWSFRDNACDVPTDCPQRERSGWTGDWQLFIPTAAFLYDVAGFSVKWLRDLAAQQMADGLVANYAPDARRDHAVASGDITWFGMLGSAGWGDAAVIVPWELYRHYDDEAILAETWPMMTGWLRYASNAARTRRHPARAAARPEPEPHEQYLWDGGWHWGEWCEVAAEGAEPFYLADQGAVATAYLHHTAALAARIGRLLGHDDEADDFDALAAGALDAWRREYLRDDGTIVPDTQANHVRALAFHLVPDALRPRIATRLVELVREADTHLTTGFLATPLLLPTLADAGHLDVAYELLLQRTPPSWLAMVDRDATTVWEEWEGIDEHGAAHASLNHYSKGAVVSFLHRYASGIRLDDADRAYRRFRVEPQPGGGITWAEAVHDSPYGRIESSWRLAGDTFELTVTVPPGATADIVLPDGTSVVSGPGTTHHRCPAR